MNAALLVATITGRRTLKPYLPFKKSNFLHFQVGRIQKLWTQGPCGRVHTPTSHLVEFPLPNIYQFVSVFRHSGGVQASLLRHSPIRPEL